MDNPERNDLPELPSFIGEALERETLTPDNLLFMCGITPDELADEIAEFSTEVESRYGLSEADEVIEQTAYRVAGVLDTITSQIYDTALADLGKEFLANLAQITLSQVCVEQRAITRHRAGELDHNCQQESCPMGAYEWLQVSIEKSRPTDLNDNSGQTFASKLEAATFDSEWE